MSDVPLSQRRKADHQEGVAVDINAKGDLYWGFKIFVAACIARWGWHLGEYVLGKL
jgi:hypothetical protein